MKKYGYSEVVFNESRIRKLYFEYLHQTFFDKMLDVLVFFAVLVTFMTVFLEMFFNVSKIIILSLHSFSVLVLFIFGLELFRDYAHSHNRKSFFKNHWLDFVLVSFLSVYFITATYFGLSRLKFLIDLKNYFSEFKNYKIFYRALTFWR